MAYTEAAADLRRCTDTRRDGTPCQAWAVWDTAPALCIFHGGKPSADRTAKHTKRMRRAELRRPVCRCAAYSWPHRPGSGVCRWPEAPQEAHATPLGSRSGFRGAVSLRGRGIQGRIQDREEWMQSR